MNSRGKALLLLAVCLPGCGGKPDSATTEKPAKLEPHPSELDIYRIVLTPKAEERLQITTAVVEMREVPRQRLLGGDLMIPDGRRISVTAPLTGTLLPPEDGAVAAAGQQVKANQTLLRLTPMLPPERDVPNAAERMQIANARASLVTAQIQATGDYTQAVAQLEAAKIALDRARQLLADKAGSRRAVDEAEATWNIATRALEAATERKELLDKLNLEAEGGEVTVIAIRAPHDGIVQTVSARTGQVVNAGAVLLDIVDLSKLWVRAPVYAGMVEEIDANRDAMVSGLAEAAENYSARPIEAPPTADPLGASIDLYYELNNSQGIFRPGQRVTVHVPLQGDAQSLVVPSAAVLWDVHGTGWVYIESAKHEYRRVRVSVQFTTAEFAVLGVGPEVGARVVVDGAAELFGTEFGAGK